MYVYVHFPGSEPTASCSADWCNAFRHEPAVTVNPGDELKTYCTFQSRSRTTTTTYGEGSFDEMCLAFLHYYPADNLTERYCYKWKDSDMCDMFDVCDFNSIVDSTNASTAAMIDKVRRGGHEGTLCSKKNDRAFYVVSRNVNLYDYLTNYRVLLIPLLACLTPCLPSLTEHCCNNRTQTLWHLVGDK